MGTVGQLGEGDPGDVQIALLQPRDMPGSRIMLLEEGDAGAGVERVSVARRSTGRSRSYRDSRMDRANSSADSLLSHAPYVLQNLSDRPSPRLGPGFSKLRSKARMIAFLVVLPSPSSRST